MTKKKKRRNRRLHTHTDEKNIITKMIKKLKVSQFETACGPFAEDTARFVQNPINHRDCRETREDEQISIDFCRKKKNSIEAKQLRVFV